MSDAAFWGCLLLAGGPPVVLYCFVIARQSFLVLLSLARLAVDAAACQCSVLQHAMQREALDRYLELCAHAALSCGWLFSY